MSLSYADYLTQKNLTRMRGNCCNPASTSTTIPTSACNCPTGARGSIGDTGEQGETGDTGADSGGLNLTQGTSRYVVDSQGRSQTGYTTITAAIAAAAAITPTRARPETIWIWPGTYTENITLAGNINLAAAVPESVFIVGATTFTPTTANDRFAAENITFVAAAAAPAFTFNGTVAATPSFVECTFTGTAGNCFLATNSGVGSTIYHTDCTATAAATFKIYDLQSSVILNTVGALNTATDTASTFANTSQFFAASMRSTADCFVLTNTSSATITDSFLSNFGTTILFTIPIYRSVSIYNCTLNSAGSTYWATGNGSVRIGAVSFVAGTSVTVVNPTITSVTTNVFETGVISFDNGVTTLNPPTLTANQVVAGTATSSLASVTVGVSGELLTSQGAPLPIWQAFQGIPLGTNYSDYYYWDTYAGPPALLVGSDTFHLGADAGQSAQASFAVALGYHAGQSGQLGFAVAVGDRAGAFQQGASAVAVGVTAGATLQSANAVAVGSSAAVSGQGIESIALGLQAAQVQQSSQAVAIGSSAGNFQQLTGSVAIGALAGMTNQAVGAVAIGASAGSIAQGGDSVAIGKNAGQNTQAASAVAIGSNSGSTSQQAGAVSVGELAGVGSQGVNAVCLGNQAGNTAQGLNCIAIGQLAGFDTQTSNAIAIGTNAGRSAQSYAAIAIGSTTGQTSQRSESIAIGNAAGRAGLGQGSIAICNLAGNVQTNAFSIAIGQGAGQSAQGMGCVAIGNLAGNSGQGAQAIAIGSGVGATLQGASAITIGVGISNQQAQAIAIGLGSINASQQANSIAIGQTVGRDSQQINAIAMGRLSAVTTQGQAGIAIGQQAARFSQQSGAIAIGQLAGVGTQGVNAIAFGSSSSTRQGANSIVMGTNAGFTAFGAASIALGRGAGMTNTAANVIVFNATGTAYSPAATGFYVKPMTSTADAAAANLISYNTGTKELTYSTAKTFVIPHPSAGKRDTHWLVHGCVESRRSDVYYRGISCVEGGATVAVSLPQYVRDLADDFTVHLSVIGGILDAADDAENDEEIWWDGEVHGSGTATKNPYFNVYGKSGTKFAWMLYGRRRDVGSQFEVEPLRETVNLCGQGAYRWAAVVS